METTIQSLKRVEDRIYSLSYDDLSEYLQGVRDMMNLINGEEPSDEVADTILENITKENPVYGYKIGDKFKISLYSGDGELLDWYADQENDVLIIDHIEFDTWGVWVKDCPYRIDLEDVLLIKELNYEE